MPGIYIVKGYSRYCFEIPGDPFIEKYFTTIAVIYLVTVFLQLVQSQSQAGTASTIPGKYNAQGRFLKFGV